MRIRAFTTAPSVLLAAVLLLVVTPPSGVPHTAAVAAPAPVAFVAGVDDDDTTRPTVNEFFPEDRPLSDCLSSLPKPNCGSDARGGWGQTVVFLAIIAGLAIIAWRIVAASRRARRVREVRPGTPDATTARDGDGGVPAP